VGGVTHFRFAVVAGTAGLLALAGTGEAQMPGGTGTPGALVQEVLDRFREGPPEAFEALVSHDRARALVRSARSGEVPLRAGSGRVLRVRGEEAILHLAGHPEFGNSGDETLYGRMFSGLWRAALEEGEWRLVERLAMDEGNRIRAPDLEVILTPGSGIQAVDRMRVEVGGPHGFWVLLNHAARVEAVRVEGRPADHHVESGLLWIDVDPGAGVAVEVAYRLELDRDAGQPANSGRFHEAAGHLRGQYFWYPSFDLHSPGDRADVEIRVESPEGVRVATGLPQEEAVVGGKRITTARSERPVSGVSLLYDEGWMRELHTQEGMEVELLLTPGFEPGAEALLSAAEEAHRVLRARYGDPADRRVTLVNGRARDGGGWHFRSNGLVVGNGTQAAIHRGGVLPRSWLAHELAHGWTHPIGAAANLLSEGWAMFAEGQVVEERFGVAAAEAYWEHLRNVYHRDGFEGRASLLEDPDNGGIAYYKGAWVFRMLQEILGDTVLNAGLRSWMAGSVEGGGDLEGFVAALSRAADRDVEALLRPWLVERRIPDIRAEVAGDRVILVQQGPVFHLPLEVELETDSGIERRRVELREARTELVLGRAGSVLDIRIDPDRRLLLHRHRGEWVTFELEAQEASTVELLGDFTRRPIPAERVGDRWRVELPLAEGRYAFWWGVDGDHRYQGEPQVLEVQGRELLDGAAAPEAGAP
jgi:hypothetical protein